MVEHAPLHSWAYIEHRFQDWQILSNQVAKSAHSSRSDYALKGSSALEQILAATTFTEFDYSQDESNVYVKTYATISGHTIKRY